MILKLAFFEFSRFMLSELNLLDYVWAGQQEETYNIAAGQL